LTSRVIVEVGRDSRRPISACERPSASQAAIRRRSSGVSLPPGNCPSFASRCKVFLNHKLIATETSIRVALNDTGQGNVVKVFTSIYDNTTVNLD
jgi:hypothetical protein